MYNFVVSKQDKIAQKVNIKNAYVGKGAYLRLTNRERERERERERDSKPFWSLVKFLFFCFLAFVIACLCASDAADYFLKRSFGLPNVAIIFIALFLFFVIVAISSKVRVSEKCLKVSVYVTLGILLCLHLFLSFTLVFLGSWDVGVLFSAAWNITHGWQGVPCAPEGWNEFFTRDQANYYFSTYPNNLFLLSLIANLIKVMNVIGFEDISATVTLCSVINSLFIILTGLMVYDILKRKCEAPVVLCGFFAWVVLVGLSPWFLVPYSDSFVIIVPIAVCWLLVKTNELDGTKKALIWMAIIVLSVLGTYIKPQMIFILVGVLFAIGFSKIKELFTSCEFKQMAKISGAFFLAVVCSLGLKNVLVSTVSSELDIDEQQGFSYQHYLLMGLNDETDGVYFEDDVAFSHSFPTKNERQNADLELAAERIEEYGFFGLVKHEVKKTLVVWADSSFAWNGEGGFFAFIVKGNSASFLLLQNSEFHSVAKMFSVVCQCVWFVILLGMLASVLVTEERAFACVLMVSLLCLGLFELIFEARARYLYAFVPCMIVLAGCGLNSILKFKDKKLEGSK